MLKFICTGFNYFEVNKNRLPSEHGYGLLLFRAVSLVLVQVKVCKSSGLCTCVRDFSGITLWRYSAVKKVPFFFFFFPLFFSL